MKSIYFLSRKSFLLAIVSFFTIITGLTFGQSNDLTGEWVIQFGNGTKNNVRIEQNEDKIIFWLQNNDEVMTFSGSLINNKLKVSSPLKNRWPKAKWACHEEILAQLENYPSYKTILELNIKENKLIGTYTYPKNISCEGGVTISLSDPNSVILIPVNYVYWSVDKKIFKAPTNQPNNKKVIVESNDNIYDVTLDKDAKRIYWSEGKYINSANQEGKSKQTITTAEEEVFSPRSLVINNNKNKIIWVEDRKIMSTQLNHDNRVALLEEKTPPHSLVIDSINHKIYWLLNYSDKIRRANLDGTDVEDFAIDKDARDLSIDAKNGYLYWNTHMKIRRINLKSPQNIEDLLSGLLLPNDIFIDTDFNKIYWQESNQIFRSNLDGKRKELFNYAYGISSLAIASKGPTSYEQTKIKGSMLIKSAVAGKSLLQELVKNDTYYQVLLSEYAQKNSEFNLTDARLLLIWGENFPQRLFRGNNIIFSSSDPKIIYYEYDTWNYKLDDLQKEKYINHQLWLSKNSGLKSTTWNLAWNKIKDSLGSAKLDSIKEMDHMLVLASPKDGVLPGLKGFTMNEAEAEWYLSVGNVSASMRFLRKLPNGEEETIHNIYAGDPFFIEINTTNNVDLSNLDLSYFIDNEPIQTESVPFIALRYNNSKTTYRTQAITLQEFSENGGQLQNGIHGNVEGVCKIGSLFKAKVTNAALFNNGNPPTTTAPLKNPISSIWHQTLGEATVLSKLSIQENEWEKSISKPIATFTNMDISAIPSGGITSSCSVTLGDYAAMILLRRYFVKHMNTYYESLNKHRDDPVFQYGFWEMMAPQMVDPNFPLGNIEVTNKEVSLRNAFLKDYILKNYQSPEEAEIWIKDAKKDGFIKYLSSIKKSLDAANKIDDKEVKKLLDLTGFGFKSMISQVTSDLQMKKFPSASEYVCEVVPHIWEPDNLGRASVKTMNNTAKHCRANEDLQAAGTDVILASASLLVFPIGAYATYGKITAAVYGAALGSGEIIRDNIKFSAEDEELDFSSGSFAVLGTERYAMAKLKVTPTWARMLSYFGGGLGVAGDAFDILKYVGKVDMASAYAKLPLLLNDIDNKGAIEAYQALNQSNKAKFLLLLGEAEELKKIPIGQLNDTQKRLLSAAEQFANELDIAAKSKKAVVESGELVADLSDGLPTHLKDKVPIIKDETIPGNTVRLEYELDANGFLKNIQIRAGKTATSQNIAEHVPTLSKMKEYEAVASRAGNLYRKIRYWYRRAFSGEPPLGSPAWESMQEIKKLNYIIEGRLNKLISGIGDSDVNSFTRQIQDLSTQLNKHQKAFEEFVTNPKLARGFVAAIDNNSNGKTTKLGIKKEIENLTNQTIVSSNTILKAKAIRIKKALDFLNRSPQRLELYDAVVSQSAKIGNPDLAIRFLDRLSYFEDLTSDQLRGMRSFLKATDDTETLTLILQRGIPRQREFIEYNRNALNDVLNMLTRSKDSPKTLKGISDYVQTLGNGRVGSIDRLRALSDKIEFKNYEDIFTTISDFKGYKNFKKILTNLSSDNQNSFIGALGQLRAARDVAKDLKKGEIFFEFKFSRVLNKKIILREIDILVKDVSGKIKQIIECKEYVALNSLSKYDIKRQFAKDIFILHKNEVSLSTGMRWMISNQVRKGATELATKEKLRDMFLTIFENTKIKKEIFCGMKKSDIIKYRTALEDNFTEIFQFF